MSFWEFRANQVLTLLGVLSLLLPIMSATMGNPVVLNASSHGIAGFIALGTALYLGSRDVTPLQKLVIFPASWWGVSMTASMIYIFSSHDLNVGIAQLVGMMGCSLAYFMSFVWVQNRMPSKHIGLLFAPSMVLAIVLFLHVWIRYLSGQGQIGTIQIIGFLALGFTALMLASNFILFTLIPHWALTLAMVFSGSLLFGFTLQIRAHMVDRFFFSLFFGGQWLPLLTITFLVSLINMPSLRETKYIVTKDNPILKIMPPIATLVILVFTVFPLHKINENDDVAAMLLGAMVLFWALTHVQSIAYQGNIIKELNVISRTDTLTLIPNRLAMLSTIIKMGETQPESYVIVFGINRFKQVNAHAGPSVGDLILQEVSKVAQRIAMNYNGTAGRLGGDEFVIILRGKRTDALGCAEDLSHEFSLTSETSKMANVHIKVAIGIARQDYAWTQEASMAWWEEMAITRSLTHSPQYVDDLEPVTMPSDDPMRSINEATQAMRHAKQLNLPISWYSQELEAVENRNLVMESHLEHALENDELKTYFQPIIGLQTGLITSIEALSRWEDQELGDISPAEFIPIAERSGLIESLGWSTFKRTLDLLQETASIMSELTCSVNVSPMQLRSPGFVTTLNDLTSMYTVARSQLVLEVTEGLFMDFEDPAVATLHRLSEYGYRIALDDFGMGYSSWSRMSSLPVDIIKIDRSLTVNINDMRGLAVVKSIVDMSRSLDLSVVAEGIETDSIRDTLTEMGAALGQGWLWAKALPKAEMIELLRRQSEGEVFTLPITIASSDA